MRLTCVKLGARPPSPDAWAFVVLGASREVNVADTEIIRVTDDTTRAEIAEALTNLARYAARQLHHPDCSTWVRAHERIDALLDDWQRAPV